MLSIDTTAAAAALPAKVKNLSVSSATSSNASSGELISPLSFALALPSVGICMQTRWLHNPSSNEWEFLVPVSCALIPSTKTPTITHIITNGQAQDEQPQHLMPVTFAQLEQAVLQNKDPMGVVMLAAELGLRPDLHFPTSSVPTADPNDDHEDGMSYALKRVFRRLAEEQGVSSVCERYRRFEDKAFGIPSAGDVTEWWLQ